MSSLNESTFLGNLTRDPESRQVGENTVCNFSLALNSKYKDSKTGNMVEKTTYVDLAFWGKTGEVAQKYLKKGHAVLVKAHTINDVQEINGKKYTFNKYVGDELHLLNNGAKPAQASEGGSQPN